MPIWKHYQRAESINNALQALINAPGLTRLVAGGTDLILDLQQGRHPSVDTLVDITRIPELLKIEKRSGELFIGAAVPLAKIERSNLVYENAQALVEACALIGGPQVRNSATLGGNVAHGLPAADGTIGLLALGAKAEVANIQCSYTLPIEDLFVGPGRTNLHPQRDLLVGFYLPLKKSGMASAFQRVMRPQGVALPIINMAVWLHRKINPLSDDKIGDIRISIGPGGPVPTRAKAAEVFLRNQTVSENVLVDAMEIILEEVNFRTSPYRATSGYRQNLAKVLLREVLITAWMRAL
jgi:carbon-monoxide dehydrogenase medium subunit